jgi:hypothetical protein
MLSQGRRQSDPGISGRERIRALDDARHGSGSLGEYDLN